MKIKASRRINEGGQNSISYKESYVELILLKVLQCL